MMSPRQPRPLIASFLLLFASCAGGGRPEAPATSIHLAPPPAASPPGLERLPALPVTGLHGGPGERRIEQIEVVEQDLRVVLRSLAEGFGLDYQIDPGISGRVSARLQDVSLADALDAIVLPHGFTYVLQDDVLRVMPAQVASRIFTLDYMSISRVSVGTTVIQRRLGPATGFDGGGAFGGIGGGGGFGAGGAAGAADFIQNVTIADLWEEIRVALEGLVFDAAPAGVAADPAALAPGMGPRGPTPFSRVDPDGRRLIINPLPGTIVVAAPVAKLEEVAALLAAIEGSIHRQVLIEARIVEIALNRDFRFGVDWSALGRIGNVRIAAAIGEAGTQLTLSAGGPDLDRQISVLLRALEQQGEVNVLSAPRVSVLNNQRATINVATDEVFFAVTRQPIIGPTGGTIGFDTQIIPQQIAVGIVLDVLPQIALDNVITMNVRPVITDVVEVREVRLDDGTQASAPVIDRRETDTIVRVRDGETIVIGGLMRTVRRTTRSGVPVLNRAPLIGRVFGGYREQTEKRELVIFITPTIVAGQPMLAR
jgi:MSHA biogenesis protein MshL